MHQARRGVVRFADRDPDTRLRQTIRHSLDVLPTNGVMDTIGDRQGFGFVGNRVEENHELIPADPSRVISRPGGLSDRLRRRDEQPVTNRVAEGVIDFFEPIEVDEAEADMAVFARRSLQSRRDVGGQLATIG